LYFFRIQRINGYLVRWMRKKYKRLRTFKKAHEAWGRVTAQYPLWFAHWKWTTGHWREG
jgi:RNA-directed DNA polymerase